MKAHILYCPTWTGYDTRAASLAAELNQVDGYTATIAPGGKGQFDVFVDDKLLFSKHAEGRFPENDEVLAKL